MKTNTPNTRPAPSPSTLPPIDVARLRADLRELENALRKQKETIKRADPHETQPLWSALRRLKREATLLCAIQAHRRGRLHLRRCLRSHAHLGLPQIEVFTFELQARLIGDAWRPYLLAERAEEVEQPEEQPVLSSMVGAA